MGAILLRSSNKKAISAIKTLAKELKMEVDDSFKTINEDSKSPTKRETLKEKWTNLVKSRVLGPSDPSMKVAELAGIWTSR